MHCVYIESNECLMIVKMIFSTKKNDKRKLHSGNDGNKDSSDSIYTQYIEIVEILPSFKSLKTIQKKKFKKKVSYRKCLFTCTSC